MQHYSEVDSKCEIDNFSELQIPGESTNWKVDIWRGHVSNCSRTEFGAQFPRAFFAFPIFTLVNPKALTHGMKFGDFS